MSSLSKINVDDVEYDIKDAIARGLIGDLTTLGTAEKSDLVKAVNELVGQVASLSGITYLESTDTANMVSIRDLDSATYVFYGRFKPFAASTATLTFSSKLLVNVVKRTADTQVMVFYPVNNCVQYLKITDDTYERKNIYLNDLMNDVQALEDAVGDITILATTTKADLVSAINELVNSAFSGSYEDLTNKPTIPTVPSALKNPNALTINGKTYDGSAAVDMTDNINNLIDAKLEGIENGTF